uniref:Rhophilin n=1 Tax=Strigamia maritima TaxID=126957 RepID=T1ISB1_STRMM
MSTKQLSRSCFVNGYNKTVVRPTHDDMSTESNYFAKIVRGCDPRAQTCRGKLQSRRSKLNQEINKELMLRNGAENLFKATNNKKLRETVALELSFVNSNLQLLKEQLAELNSSVDVYQNRSANLCVPMIPLGLKETKDVDFQESFKDFIHDHYYENGNKYDDSIQDFRDIRQAMRTPMRDQSGINLLFEYYNHLHYIERRFFSSDKSLGVYDSLTGVPSCQRTVAFEKASVLFNIAALYTQIGARQDRTKNSGIDASVDKYLRSAGMFRFIQEHFSQAPSMDLSVETLDMLVSLMLAQARECLFEKLILNGNDEKTIEQCLEIAQESAQVADVYDAVHKCISSNPVKDYVPYSWISLVLVKVQHYKALSHYYLAIGLLDYVGELKKSVCDTLQCIQISNHGKSMLIDYRAPQADDEQRLLGKAHLREALLLHEESIRVHRMCRQLRKVDTLLDMLKASHTTSLNKYADIEEEDDFQEVVDPPAIQASTKYQLTLMPPDFSQFEVKDLFHQLGPLAIFSAKNNWTPPRIIKLRKRADESFGFSVRGDSPVIIAGVDGGSLAEVGGMKEGDFIVSIGDIDAKSCHHDEVVSLIKAADCQLTLTLVTPINRNFLKPRNPCHSPVSSASSSGMSSLSCPTEQSPTSSICSNKSKDSNWRRTWNPFKRSDSKEKMSMVYSCNSLGRR